MPTLSGSGAPSSGDFVSPGSISPSMQINLFTLFPEVHPGHLGVSILGKARDLGLWRLNVVNIRDFAFDKHAQVDDTPYGGGPGMVMRSDVIDRALASVYQKPSPAQKLIYLSPRGAPLKQAYAARLAQEQELGLLCGRFEGVDERVLNYWGIEEVSIGDYVLTNGDIAAQVLLDSILRLRPGVLGDAESFADESFSGGLLEYPQYTKPRNFHDMEVPEVLISGHHGRIETWRREKALEITKARRPDLLDKKF